VGGGDLFDQFDTVHLKISFGLFSSCCQ